MKIKNVGFTENVVTLVNAYASNNNQDAYDLFNTIAYAVSNEIPRGKFDVDTSDNSITFAGVPLSFVRNWNNGDATVMTVTEATALDNNTMAITTWISL